MELEKDDHNQLCGCCRPILAHYCRDSQINETVRVHIQLGMNLFFLPKDLVKAYRFGGRISLTFIFLNLYLIFTGAVDFFSQTVFQPFLYLPFSNGIDKELIIPVA